MNFFRQRDLSAAAFDRIHFDADSIRRLGNPDVWLADPDAYEKNGRVLRDSESPRMLGYSRTDHVLYVTDGCNTCAHNLDLSAVSSLQVFAEKNELRLDLLDYLRELATKSTKGT